MADGLDKDQDILGDHWLTNWEEECVEEWENESMSNMEERIPNENERSTQKLWMSFQNSASAISQLYKDGCSEKGVSLWVPFQNSASCVTALFKESQELMKKSFELGNHYGHLRRSKEVLAWAKKRHRYIRREDLLAFICGKNPPVRHRPSSTLTKSSSRLDRSSPRLPSPRVSATDVRDSRDEPDLQPFRDALALQGLSGAMSNVSVGINGHAQDGAEGVDDFHCFILDEISRRCGSRKRTSNPDVIVDSPTRKRSRLL